MGCIAILLTNIAGGITVIEDRYYVQRLTEQVYVVRERLSAGEGSGSDDRIVRSFIVGHDAYMYADSLNEKQRELDQHYGIWAQHAV